MHRPWNSMLHQFYCCLSMELHDCDYIIYLGSQCLLGAPSAQNQWYTALTSLCYMVLKCLKPWILWEEYCEIKFPKVFRKKKESFNLDSVFIYPFINTINIFLNPCYVSCWDTNFCVCVYFITFNDGYILCKYKCWYWVY